MKKCKIVDIFFSRFFGHFYSAIFCIDREAWVVSEHLIYPYHINVYQGKSECHSSCREPFDLGGVVDLNVIG